MKKIIPFEKEIDFKTMLSNITNISLEHTLRANEENFINGYFIIEGTYKMTQASQIDEEFSYKIPVDIEIDDKYDTTNIMIDIDDFTYKILENDKLLLKISLSIDGLVEKPEIENEELIITELEAEFDDEKNEREIETIDNLFLETSVPEKLDVELNIASNQSELNLKQEINKENIDVPQKNDIFVESNTYKNEKLSNNNIIINEDDKHYNNSNNINVNEGVESLFSSFKDGVETFKTYSVYIIKEDDTIETIQKKYNIDRDSLEEYNDLSKLIVGSKIIIPSKKNE